MSQGVCYFLCGNWRQYLGPLAVSLHSLRRHYNGQVCVLVGDDALQVVTDRQLIPLWHGKDRRLEFKAIPLADVPRHRHYVTKASLWWHSPFERTVLLDADTVVTGTFHELFWAPLCVTRFSDWVTTGKRVGGRIRQWLLIDKECGQRAETALGARWCAINTGVIGWHRNCSLLPEWESLAQRGWRCSFTDELALQLMVPDMLAVERIPQDSHAALLVDDRFNCSATYGVHRDDARIWHYHGRRMVRKPEGRALYRPHLRAALDANAYGIADWLPKVDPALTEVS